MPQRDPVGRAPAPVANTLARALRPACAIPHAQLSFQEGELIFARGQASRDLIFLLEGEVLVLDYVDDQTPERHVRRGDDGDWVERMGGELACVTGRPAYLMG